MEKHVDALIQNIKPAAEIVEEIWNDYLAGIQDMPRSD